MEELATQLVAAADDDIRFRLAIEFLDEFSVTDQQDRSSLLDGRPASVGDPRWDAMLGALAEHCAFHSRLACPNWAFEAQRYLSQSWYPTDLPSVRATAVVHSPAAFRLRGIFIDDSELASA